MRKQCEIDGWNNLIAMCLARLLYAVAKVFEIKRGKHFHMVNVYLWEVLSIFNERYVGEGHWYECAANIFFNICPILLYTVYFGVGSMFTSTLYGRYNVIMILIYKFEVLVFCEPTTHKYGPIPYALISLQCNKFCARQFWTSTHARLYHLTSILLLGIPCNIRIIWAKKKYF